MKFTFIGVPGESHKTIHMYGTDMPIGEPIEVSAVAARKLANHPHFEVFIETKTYEDGTTATGPGPLPKDSPAETVQPVEPPSLESLNSEAKALGIDVKGTWGIKNITEAIAAAKAT